MSEVQAQAGGPGARLGAARRQQGLHIAALAAQLKVPVARLEALEAERWSELPDATHARALATSVCRVLNLDAAAVLAGMPRATGAALERVSAGLNQPVRDGAGWRAPRAWLWAGAVLLLVLAAALALWPRDRGLGEWVGAWTEGLSGGQATERSVVPTASSQPTLPTLAARPIPPLPRTRPAWRACLRCPRRGPRRPPSCRPGRHRRQVPPARWRHPPPRSACRATRR
jgi:cytoskeleton protein RodZ